MKPVSILLYTALSVILLFCSDPNSPKENNDPAGYSGYKLVWQDEFNGASLDLAKWNYETGTGVNGDFGTGQIDRATERSENIGIKNNIENADQGCLQITTRKEFYIDRNFTSARINTSNKASWGPGYKIEARIRPTGVKYKGQGFAFWMMPAEKPTGYDHLMWPQGGEIDIMEYVGSIPYHNLGSVHYAWSWENNQWQSWNHTHKGAYYSFETEEVPAHNPDYGNYPPQTGDKNAGSSDFHIYGINWFDDRMEFYVDQNIYHVHYFNDGFAFDNGKADGEDKEGIKMISNRRVLYSEYSNHFDEWHPYEHQFYLILSAGVGGNDNQTYGGAIVNEAEFPCSVYIDWVRVYKKS